MSFLVPAAGAQTFAELNARGAAAHAAGRYADAEALFRRALAESSGASESQQAVLWSNVAAACKRQERYVEAETAFEQTVQLRRRAHGPNDVRYALALNSLGEIRRILGRPDAARLFERAAAALPLTAMPEDRAALLNNLGTVRLEQRRFREAISLLEESLRLKALAFPSCDPQLGVTLNNLASAHHELGNYQEAEASHLRALAIWDANRAFASDAALTMANLGRLYASMGRLSAALEMEHRALRTLGQAGLGESRFAAGVWHNVAMLRASSGDAAGAAEAFLRCISIRERVFGPGHPLVAQAQLDRDQLSGKTHNAREREPLTIDVLELRKSW